MATNKVATVVVLDVGISTSNLYEKETFFKKSQWCVLRIIQRIIFSDENDELGILIFGSEETENALAHTSDFGKYSNIFEYASLQKPDWSLYEKVQKLSTTEVKNSNWFEGIVAGLQFLKDSVRGKKFKDKQLIVLSNFLKDIKYGKKDLDSLAEKFNSEDIKLVVIGVDTGDEETGHLKLSKLNKTLPSLLENIDNGITLNFSEAEDEITYYQRKRKMLRFAKVNLTIGSSIEIPVRWIKINLPPNRIKWAVKPWRIISVNAVHETPEANKEIEVKLVTQVKKRTKFGSNEVVLNYADLAAMERKTGRNSCILLGCVKRGRVPRKFFVNQDIYLVVPEKNARDAQTMLSAFIDALIEADKYALVRRVLTTNGRLKIGVMIPVSNGSFKELYFMQLPFAEYATVVPDILLPEPDNQELLETIDELINKMTILDEPKSVPMKDPNFQLKCHILSQFQTGQLSRDEEITVPDFIKKLCDPYPTLRDDAMEIIKKLEEQIPIRIDENVLQDDETPVVKLVRSEGAESVGKQDFIIKPGTSKNVNEDWENAETEEWPQNLKDKYKPTSDNDVTPAVSSIDSALSKNKYDTSYISEKIWEKYGKTESKTTEEVVECSSDEGELVDTLETDENAVNTAEMLLRVQDLLDKRS